MVRVGRRHDGHHRRDPACRAHALDGLDLPSEDVRCAAGPVYGGAPDEVATSRLTRSARRGVSDLGWQCLDPTAFPGGVRRDRLPGPNAGGCRHRQARLIKSADEIAVMEESGRIADAAFAAVFAALAPGVEETEVAAAAVSVMLRRGAIEVVPYLCGRRKPRRSQAFVSAPA